MPPLQLTWREPRDVCRSFGVQLERTRGSREKEPAGRGKSWLGQLCTCSPRLLSVSAPGQDLAFPRGVRSAPPARSERAWRAQRRPASLWFGSYILILAHGLYSPTLPDPAMSKKWSQRCSTQPATERLHTVDAIPERALPLRAILLKFLRSLFVRLFQQCHLSRIEEVLKLDDSFRD